MKTFIELKRVNRQSETKVVLLDTSKVIAITEIHTEGKVQPLYDEEGNLVEEKEIEKAPLRYRVVLEGTTMEIIVDDENYQTLKTALMK